ncbi:hypothetical protein [uncultured Marinobacter sp.]|uniref:hypothetical protein n=1 Tax=uncultured Marinobacter sp. TaxID=187379 RepID=UPI0025E7B705|nr:hypothetical protein [uncultured Marinobacter sp.]
MAIKRIDSLAIYFNGEDYSLNRRGPLPYPLIVVLDFSGKILAAIKFSYRNEVWHVENVTAREGYGPTVYRVLMQLAGENGLAPIYKKPYKNKDLIVERCKKIWSIFFESAEIKKFPIDNNHKECFLNNKFILSSNKLDLEKAFVNFDRLIDKKFSNSFRKKPLQKFRDLVFKYPEIEREKSRVEFSEAFKFQLHADAQMFLEESVAVHQ